MLYNSVLLSKVYSVKQIVWCKNNVMKYLELILLYVTFHGYDRYYADVKIEIFIFVCDY